jgi:nitrogen-specific signal transduction histidine kinase
MNSQFENNQARLAEASGTHHPNQDLHLDKIDSIGNETSAAELIVMENGMILACNKASGQLLGCELKKLTWLPISKLFPQLTDITLMLGKEVNPYLRFLSIAGHRFEVIRMNGVHFASELFFSAIDDFGKCCLKITLRPIRQGQPVTLRHLRTY